MPPLVNKFPANPLAKRVALWSVLNLTVLPGIAFVVMLWCWRQAVSQQDTIGIRHGQAGLLLNLTAGLALFGVSLFLWHWSALHVAERLAAIITYFTFVHSLFILWAVWNWSRAGQNRPPLGWS